MNNTFRITISAVDKATAVVRHVKDSFSQITRPVSDLKNSVVSLGRETGLDKVGKSLLDIGNATSSLASKMAGVFPALGGGLGLAAIASLAGHWGDLGAEVGRTSRNIGVSTQQLQEWRAAARRANVEPEALDSSLKGLGATMEDVFFYRASPEAITSLRQMGIQFHKTASGAPNLAAALGDVANAVQRLEGNPYAQRKLLQSLGVSEDMLPLLRRGSAGIREYVTEYQKTRGMIGDDDIRRADAFRESMINLGDALSGVGTRLASNASYMTDFNNAMAQWIADTGPNPFAEITHMAADQAKAQLSSPVAAGAFGAAMGMPPDSAVGIFEGSLDAVLGLQPPGSVAGSPASQPIMLPQYGKNPRGAPLMPTSSKTSAADLPIPPGSRGISIDALAPPPSVNDVASAAAATSPKLSIELLLKNAPPGMQARARTADGQEVPARVEYSMPTTVTP